MTESKSSPPPVVVADRYELARQIATGGMASVHLANDRVLDRTVAVKILHPGFAADPVFVARFRQEAKAAGRLNHPKVVAVYDWGRHEDSYYIAMEYVAGETLAEHLETTGPLPPDRAIEIAIDVLDALEAAHGRGLVHRDIKPSNLIVGPAGTKVADFGIMRAYRGEDETEETGSIIGTASYMSPEQAQGLAVDPRSDLYSLGVLLFKMLTGHRPFTADSPVAIALQHIDTTPPRASSFGVAVPPALQATLDRLLAKAPDDRFATAADVRRHLQRLRADGSIRTAVDPVAADETRTAIMPTAVMPVPRERPSPPDEPGPVRREGRGVPLVALAALVAAIVGLLLVAGVQISQRTGSDEAEGVEAGEDPAAPTDAEADQGPTTTGAEVETGRAPDLLGETQARAERLVRDLGLTPRVVGVEVDDPDLDGRVVAQEPGADETIEAGGVVTIEVGRLVETTTTTASTTTAPSTTAAPTTTTASPTTAPPTTAAPTSTPTTGQSTSTTP